MLRAPVSVPTPPRTWPADARLLRRRRLTGLAGVTAAVLCGVLVPLALQGSGPGHHPAPATAASSRPAESLTVGPGGRA